MLKRLLLDRQTQVRFIKFFIVGGTAYVVNIGCFAIVKSFLLPNISFTAAFLVSTATHYCLNRFWALKSTRTDKWRQFIEYLGTVVVSYMISIACFTLFRAYMSLGLAQALSIPPSTIVVFVILNFWVFKHYGEAQKSN